MARLTYPKFQAPDLNGVNLSGGKANFYISGTSTRKDTYSDEAMSVVNANPVILDARGEADIYGDGSYKVVLTDSNDVEIWSEDNYYFDKLSADLASTATDDGTKGFHLVHYPPLTGETGVVNYEYEYGNVKRYGAKGDGSTDDTASIQAAMNYSAGTVCVIFPPGTYITSSALRVKGGASLRGQYSPKAGKLARIHNTTTTHFDTDDTDSSYLGIAIKDIRLTGGVAGSYAFTSHYPYTFIDGLYIENTTGLFAGNGIRIHQDNNPGSMGGWGSKIENSKVVLDDTDAVNKRTCIDLDINGGNVTVDKTEVIKCEVGINIVKGENITLSELNTNKCWDQTSTSGSISKAAIIVGNGTSGFDVKNLTIRDAYIESHSRAVLINNAVNTVIENTFINDTEYHDPVFVTPDGAIMHTQYASNTKILNSWIETGYATQRILHQVIGTNMIGMSVDNTYLYLDRVANPYTAGHVFSNDPLIFESIKATHFKSTISSSDTHSDLVDIVKASNRDVIYSDISIATATPTTLFTILAGEVWEVISNQYDDDARFVKAIVHKPLSGAAAGVDTIVAGTLNAISLSTDAVQITQTTGITRRMITICQRIL